jgi:hypothetical protein
MKKERDCQNSDVYVLELNRGRTVQTTQIQIIFFSIISSWMGVNLTQNSS